MPADGSTAGDGDGEPARAEAAARRGDATGSGIAVLLALVVFVVSLLAIPVALATGADVVPAIASNAVAAVALVTWTARRTFTDPDSSVTSVPGALGTALVLLGAYGVVLAGALFLTGSFHDRGGLVGPIAVAALGACLLGLGTFAFETVFESPQDDPSPAGDAGDAGEAGEPTEDEAATGRDRD